MGTKRVKLNELTKICKSPNDEQAVQYQTSRSRERAITAVLQICLSLVIRVLTTFDIIGIKPDWGGAPTVTLTSDVLGVLLVSASAIEQRGVNDCTENGYH